MSPTRCHPFKYIRKNVAGYLFVTTLPFYGGKME
jgi:hypothetical protein